MYKIQRKAQSEGGGKGSGGGEGVLRFHGNCLNAMKINKNNNGKKNITEMFGGRNAAESFPRIRR